jgi:hypothetical protein
MLVETTERTVFGDFIHAFTLKLRTKSPSLLFKRFIFLCRSMVQISLDRLFNNDTTATIHGSKIHIIWEEENKCHGT